MAFLACWQLLSVSGAVNPLFISSPSQIVHAFLDMAADGTLRTDLAASGHEFVVGFGLAILIGVPLGIVVGWYRLVNAVLSPFVTSLYATPRIALAPLIIIWFGVGLWSTVAIVFLGAVFPLVINMQTAMRTLDAELLRAARSFGASELDIFRTVALPSSVPFLISGLRLSLGHALIGVVVGELFGATAGVGYRIVLAGAMFQTDQVFVSVFVLVATALTFNTALLALERRADRWRPRP